MVNGCVTYQVASDFSTGSPSDSDDNSESDDVHEPEPESPRSGTGSSRDSEDETSDEGGKGMPTGQPAELMAVDAPGETDDIATAGGDQRSMDYQTASIALVNVRVSCHALTMAAMPNVREKDVSISVRNHEPDSFEQYKDNHDMRPLPDSPPPPKLQLLAAMELLASMGVVMEVKLETVVDELGEAAVVSILVGKGATVKWSTSPLSSPAIPMPTTKSIGTTCWNCGNPGHYSSACPKL